MFFALLKFLRGIITRLSSTLNSKLPYVDIISNSITVPANSNKSIILGLTPKAGYKLGAFSVCMTSGDVIDTQVAAITNSTIQVIAKSIYGTELTRTIKVYVLYIPS